MNIKANQLVFAILLLVAPLASAQTLTSLDSFTNANGAFPIGALILGKDGNFYGTTKDGGTHGDGTVFKVTTNGALTTLISFNGANGANPEAALTWDGSDNFFYGTTKSGGANSDGTVFRVDQNGVLTTLVSFNGTNGANPVSALTLGNDGNFYGTTENGGTNGDGTVFKMTITGVLSTLDSFTGTNGANPGANPEAGVTLGPDGNFYGTTQSGGANGGGTVFKVTSAGVLTELVSFNGNGENNPVTALTLGPDGNFYGTLSDGGTSFAGTVFKITTNGVLTMLVSVNNSYQVNLNALTLGPDGNFYGTSEGNPALAAGGVFQMTTNGTLTWLAFFNGNGANPAAGVTLGPDGNFYGTTQYGVSDYGNVFRLLPIGIKTQPQSQTIYFDETLALTVGAQGLGPFSYQWQENGTNLIDSENVSGSTSNTLTLSNISAGDAGNYSVVVSNPYTNVISSTATLTFDDLPFIYAQPLSQTAYAGSNVTLTAAAWGTPPLVFQWYCNGSPIGSPAIGTSSSYNLTGLQISQSGNYSVRVYNGYGSATSSNAVLTVQALAPGIVVPPTNQTVLVGQSISFNVSVSGTPPFSYQWLFNGAAILNATNDFYSIQCVSTNDAGDYSVVITNSAGSVTSANAVLNVIVPPSMTLQFLAGYPLLNLNGMLSSNFVVQCSTNLATTNWFNLLSLTNLQESPYQFLDPAGLGQPARFYRVLMQ